MHTSMFARVLISCSCDCRCPANPQMPANLKLMLLWLLLFSCWCTFALRWDTGSFNKQLSKLKENEKVAFFKGKRWGAVEEFHVLMFYDEKKYGRCSMSRGCMFIINSRPDLSEMWTEIKRKAFWKGRRDPKRTASARIAINVLPPVCLILSACHLRSYISEVWSVTLVTAPFNFCPLLIAF